AGAARRSRIPAQSLSERLRRRLGAVFRKARHRDGHLQDALRKFWPPDVGNVAGVPAGGRYRHSRDGVDAQAGAGLFGREHGAFTARGAHRDRPLHRLAGAGAVLQDGRTEDLGTAPQSGEGAGSEIRPARLPRRGPGERRRDLADPGAADRRLYRSGQKPTLPLRGVISLTQQNEKPKDSARQADVLLTQEMIEAGAQYLDETGFLPYGETTDRVGLGKAIKVALEAGQYVVQI